MHQPSVRSYEFGALRHQFAAIHQSVWVHAAIHLGHEACWGMHPVTNLGHAAISMGHAAINLGHTAISFEM